MEPKDQSPEQFFSYILNYASVVLKCNKDTIKQFFPKAEFWNINYINQLDDTDETYLEIRVEGATITCAFDKETNLCDSSFVFFDDDNNLNNFVRICNMLYRYDLNNGYWYSSHYTISLKKDKKDIAFMFAPIKA